MASPVEPRAGREDARAPRHVRERVLAGLLRRPRSHLLPLDGIVLRLAAPLSQLQETAHHPPHTLHRPMHDHAHCAALRAFRRRVVYTTGSWDWLVNVESSSQPPR